MTNKTKTANPAQGAQVAISEVAKVKMQLEEKLLIFDNFRNQVKSLEQLTKHKEKLTKFKEVLNDDTLNNSPTINLKYGYNNEYEIISKNWLNILIDFLLNEIEVKIKEYEKEVLTFKIQ